MPMDDHYLTNPEELLQGAVADITLDLENPLILEVCAHDHVELKL